MVNKKSKLAKRYQTSYETKGGVTSNRSVFNFRDVEFEYFSPKEGRNRINIIPYEIKTKNHPLVRKGEFEIGDLDYTFDFYVHKNIGATESTVLCLKSTFGKPCPICEHIAVLKKKGEEEEAKFLKPSRRVIYNVQDLKEPEKLKIFETSHYLFEKELIDESRDDEDGGFIDFADPEDGKEIKFRCGKTSKGGFEFNEYKSFSFEPREEPLPKKLVSKAVSFDEYLTIPTYGDVEKLFYGEDDEDETEDDREECVTTPNKIGNECDDEPSKEESVTEKDKLVRDNNPCPFGHTFGDDCEAYDCCDDCECWEKCLKSKRG